MNQKPFLLRKYNSVWTLHFLQLKEVYQQALLDLTVEIEHVGSTSIKGLAAKPIIDIDIVYNDRLDFELIKSRLTQLHYYHNGDQGILGREVFKREDHQHPILDHIDHHLYICHKDNRELRRHLKLRDTLRIQPQLRQQYEQLKYRIAELAYQDRKVYAQLKEKMAKDFIEQILRE